jgi:hypothetical protein
MRPYLDCKASVISFYGGRERCRLSWLTNSALVYEPKCGEGGELRGLKAVHGSPNKLRRSHSVFNLCYSYHWRRYCRNLQKGQDLV